MVCCFWKVPHVTKRAPAGRSAIFRVFVRAFVIGYAFVSWATLIVGVVIRLTLGLPGQCSSLTESIYVATNTLIAVSVLGLVVLLLTFIRIKNFKNSNDLKPYIFLFVIVVVVEMFIAIMANFLSSRMKDIIKDNADIFAVNDCLDEIQSDHDCCGFNMNTEWLRPRNTSANSKNFGHTAKSLFPASCLCPENEYISCANVTYSISSYRSQSTQNSNSSNYTTEGDVTDIVHQTPCFQSIVNEFKRVQLASGVAPLVASVVQLTIFACQIYIIHNLEGAGTVSDNSGSSAIIENIDSSHRRSRTVSVLDINSVQLQPRDPNWSVTSSTFGSQDGSAANGSDEDDVDHRKEDLKEIPAVSLFQVLEIKTTKLSDAT